MAHALTRTTLGKYFSEGSRLLWAEFIKSGLKNFRDAEREWDLGAGTLNRLLYGERGAGRTISVKLRDRLGIPIESWSTKPSRDFKVPHAPSKPKKTEAA